MGKKRLSQLPEVQIGLPPPRSYTGHPSGGVTVGMALGQKEVRILAPTAAPSTVKSESWLYFRQRLVGSLVGWMGSLEKTVSFFFSFLFILCWLVLLAPSLFLSPLLTHEVHFCCQQQ